MKLYILFTALIVAIAFVAVPLLAQPAALLDAGPTTRPLGGAVTLSPTINTPPAQVVVTPDVVRTIDLPLWAGYHYPCTVRINVKMISAVVPHIATTNGVVTTGSAVYCWPADIWYTTTDVTTLTSQLASLGWGQNPPLPAPATTQPSPSLTTPKPYVNPAASQ